MRLLGRKNLTKLQRKNRGNVALSRAIDQLIADIEAANWTDQRELQKGRPDADCVHSDGFYIFDLQVHRTMALVEYAVKGDDEPGSLTVLWAGSHDEYERIFGNNKATAEKWLRNHGLID